MKQVLIKGGGAHVEHVPAPAVEAGKILVRAAYSCISVGTEMAAIHDSGEPLYRRALRRPEQVKKAANLLRQEGLRKTIDVIRGKLASGMPAGYSASGVVMETGPGVKGFSPGDRIACAGAGVANHAEIISVPVNLAARAPEGVELESASTVALGAIAMQGVRRAAVSLGETVGVLGLGILGQITVQLLKASGCRVAGFDPDGKRVRMAMSFGMDYPVRAGEDFPERLHAYTGGVGGDAVIVTAAAKGDEVISQAFRAIRKKGRVVLVGDVGLGLKREDIYAKEPDFMVSTSYGPGRYDPAYEEQGIDYPIAYARWTENRNMEEYLRLLAEKKVRLDGLGRIFDVDHAPEAYAALNGSGEKPLFALISYPSREEAASRTVTVRKAPARKSAGRTIKVGLAGAGAFARGTHLPNISKLKDVFDLRAVMSRTGSTAQAAARRFDAVYATTDYGELLGDDEIDLVMICSRHHLHVDMALRALRAGKNVFVEKPLALSAEELANIENFYGEAGEGAPLLMTGYNRRFSPAVTAITDALSNRSSPLIVSYRVNAGYLPDDHWTQTKEGGGRNIGEACHIYDLFLAITGSRIKDIKASSIRPSSARWRRDDNFTAVFEFDDGSVCSLTYTALGSPDHPKERMDVYGDGKVASLDDYRSLSFSGARIRGWKSAVADKGHVNMLKALGAALLKGGEWPITLEDQLAAARASFQVENLIFI